MKTIHKYPLPIEDCVKIHMPVNASILSIDEQYPGELYIWALVDTEMELVQREFIIVGTGNKFPDHIPVKHLESVVTFNGAFVWHVFEVMV